jgi:hypothetical protein
VDDRETSGITGSGRECGSMKIPDLLPRYSANLLHCRSPLSLALQARR